MRLVKHVLIIGILICSTGACAQKNNDMTNQEIVKTFLGGFDNPSKIQAAFDLLADDYTFKDPITQHNSKVEFIAAAKELGKVLTGLKILRIAENGNWVGVSYNFKSNIPGLENNIGSEWFRVENGKIQESYLVFDATKWRAIFNQAGE